MPRTRTTLKKGERIGRSKGTPNKRTTEAMERARLDIENATTAGTNTAIGELRKKLGKDVLEEWMMRFGALANRYEPIGKRVKGRKPDEAKFLRYAELTVTTAKALADFQSPKFRAIMVAASPDQQPGMRDITPAADNVLQIKDPIATARVYQRMVKQVR